MMQREAHHPLARGMPIMVIPSLQAAGVEFIPENGGAGVRLRKKEPRCLPGPESGRRRQLSRFK